MTKIEKDNEDRLKAFKQIEKLREELSKAAKYVTDHQDLFEEHDLQNILSAARSRVEFLIKQFLPYYGVLKSSTGETKILAMFGNHEMAHQWLDQQPETHKVGDPIYKIVPGELPKEGLSDFIEDHGVGKHVTGVSECSHVQG